MLKSGSPFLIDQHNVLCMLFVFVSTSRKPGEVYGMSKNGMNVGRAGTQEVKAPKGENKVKKPKKEKGGDLRAK